MKRRILSVLLAASMTLQLMNAAVFASQPQQSAASEDSASAPSVEEPVARYTGTCGENLVWVLSDNGTLTISGQGDMEDYSYDAVPWAEYASNITKVVVEEGVTSIGKYAFYNCGLRELDIPSTVTKLGIRAFAGSSITSVTIPAGVTELPSDLFYYCQNLTEVLLHDNITSLGSRAFLGSGITSITIPTGVTVLSDTLFSGCENLSEVVLHNNITSIGSRCFNGCTSLETVDLPNELTQLGQYAFAQCSALSGIELPSGVTTLPAGVFSGCDALTQITIPAGVTELGKDLFSYSGTEKITFLGDAPSLDSNTFRNATAEIFYPGTNESWTEDIMADYGGTLTWTAVFGTSGSCGEDVLWIYDEENSQLTISGTGDMWDYTEESILPWENYRDAITKVVVEEGVTSIGSWAFTDLYEMTQLSLPTTLRSIGDYALLWCGALTELTLPASLEELGLCALAGLSGLENFTVAAGSQHFCVSDGVLFSADGKTLVQFPSGKLRSIEESEEDVSWGGSYTVPAAVTAIGPGAFAHCGGLRSIILPASLTAIGPYAFLDCYSLSDVTLPEGITVLAEGLFESCWSLGTLTLNSDVTAIESRALAYASVEMLVLPTKLERIESCAFESFSGNLVLQGTPPAIAEDAFTDASLTIYYPGGEAWTEEVMADYGAYSAQWVDASTLGGEENGVTWRLVPSTGLLTVSGTGAMPEYSSNSTAPWTKYSSIISAVIVDGFTTIGSKAFMDCYNLTSVSLPAGLAYVGVNAFSGCGSLKEIEFPDSLTDIGNSAFSDSGLTRLTLPENLERIGEGAFGWNYGLTKVTFPASVTSIGDYAFASCNLTELTFLGNAPSIGGYAFQGTQGIARYPADNTTWTSEVRQSYGGNLTWTESGSTPGGVCGDNLTWTLDEAAGTLAISGTGHMYDWTDEMPAPWAGVADWIRSITVEDGVLSVGDYAFYYHYGLEQVSLPASVTSVGSCAFYGCESLAEISLPENLVELGTRAFAYCESLTEITLPTGITRLSSGLFDSCTNLEQVNFLGAVTEIGDEVFWYCCALDLDIPATVTYMGGHAFANSGLSRAVIPAGVTNLSNGLFLQCQNLTQVVFHDSVTSIGNDTFYSCSNLNQIRLPAALLSIGDEAFSWSGLTSLEIPASVTELGSYAFSYTELTEITFLGSAPEIGNYAFQNVTADVYYNGSASGWTYGNRGNYGGTLTWTAFYDTTGSCGEGVTWHYDTNTKTLTISGSGTMTDYSFSTSTAAPWKRYISEIKTVAVEAGVTHVGQYAFYNCTALTTLSLPEGLESIGSYAFSGTGLTTVTLPASLTSLSLSAFNGSSNLAAYMVAEGNNVYRSVDGVLFSADGATLLRYPVGGAAEYTVPDGVIVIGSEAFSGCSTLTAVAFNKDLQRLEDNAFSGCDSLAQLDLSGTSLTSLGSYAFSSCSALEIVQLSDTQITTIPANCFYLCSALRVIHLPAGLTDIGYDAFNGCSAVKVVIMDGNRPNANTYYGLFSGNATIYCAAGNSTWGTSWANNPVSRYVTYNDRTYLLGAETTYDAAAQLASDMGGHLAVLTDTQEVFKIQELLAQDESAVSVWLGGKENNGWAWASGEDWLYTNWAEEPGSGAYLVMDDSGKWYALEDQALPFVVELPGDGAATLTDGIITINELGMITGVIGTPTQITIPTKIGGVDVTGLYPHVLTACESLASVTVAEGHGVFSAWGGLLYSADGTTLLFCPPALQGEATVADSTTAVAQYAFENCCTITAVTLPQGLTEIQSMAFEGCTALDGIWFTGDAPTVAADMLGDSDAVLYYPQGRYGWSTPTWNGFAAQPYTLDTGIAYLTVEGGSVAYDKTTGQIVGYSAKPTRVYIPSEVDGVAITGIAANAFANCTSLNDIYIPTSVTAIAPDAFSGCTDSLSIYGGSGSTAQTWASGAGVDFVACTVKDLSPVTLSSVGGNSLTLTLRLTNSRADIPISLTCTAGNGADCPLEYTLQNKIAFGYRVYTLTVDLTALETGEYTFTLGNGDYGALAQAVYDVDRTPPSTVAGLTVTPGALINVVTWSRAAEANVTSYQIYRALASEHNFELLTTIRSRDVLYYNDKAVEADTEYEYYIIAVDTFGQTSQPCESVSAVPHADDEAPRITGITPANGSTLHASVSVTVTAEDNLQVASISLETSPDGETWAAPQTLPTDGRAVFTLDTTQWQNTVFIKVSAVDTAGNVGHAATVYQYAVDNTPPAQVTGLWGESSSTIITLHWDDVPDQDFSYFLVEEEQTDGSFAFVSRVTGALGVNLTGLTPGISHTYRVRAVDQVGNAGPWSKEVTVSTKADTTAPVIASISPASGRVTGILNLRFGVSDDYGTASITVQTSRDGSGWTDESTVTATQSGTYQYFNYALDTATLDEGLIYVRAVATDLAGNVGDSSKDAPFHQYYIDRTAPAVPTGVNALSQDGAITIQWTQGSEEDLYSYSVYRADTEDGTYVRMTSGLRQLYWTDRSVAYGSTYYYRVAVQDQAGNLSGQSDCVSAQPLNDTAIPQVVSISPSEGYVLGPNTPIRVKVYDNNWVTTLHYAVSIDGTNWEESSTNVNASDTTVSLPLELPKLNADAFQLKVWCTDASGNVSNATLRSYTLDTQPPCVPELTVNVQDMVVVLTWPGGTETDLAGYQLYRSAGAGSYTYLLQRSGGHESYTYTDTNVDLGAAYSYYLVALDKTGNSAKGQPSAPIIPVDRDAKAPQAVIEGSRIGTTGLELVFRGDSSTDNVAVTAYAWDFGDGTTSTLRTPAHAYAKAGSYTVTLTVSDAAGNTGSTTLDVTVKDPVAMGTLTVTVTDENGSPLSNAGVYLDLGSEEQCIVYTNSYGMATMSAEEGKHVVGVYITGYLPAKETVDIIANATAELDISVVEKDLVVGELTVRRMTLDEIRAAGINVYDPANQEVFEYTIQLTYGAYQETVTTYYNWSGTQLSDPAYFSLTDSNGEERSVSVSLVPTPKNETTYNPVEEPPLVVVLDLPGTASWLKDFFEVRLTVINQADEQFVLDDCVADLDLPAGLTLMDTNYTSASTICSMGSIPGQSSRSAYWVIRGDKAGEYDLSADFTAVLRDFGKTINATFTTAAPFTVRQNRGLSLNIVAENAIIADTDGAIRVGLRNDDSEPYYLPNVQLDEDLVEWVDTFKTNGRVEVETDMETLFPGETLWSDYIIPRANWESLTYWESEHFYLMDAILKATGGTTTLPYTIEEVMPFTIAADLITVTKMEQNGTESDISYINAKKQDFLTADIPSLVVRTYRLNSAHQYEPCSMEVLIRDGYKAPDGTGTTVTTDENGRYVMSGYTLETLDNDKSYTIRFSSRRAQPVEIPVVIRGDSSPTGNLTIYVYEETDEGKTPITGAQVSITDTGLSTLTGEKGGAAFTYVDKGKQEVVISADGYFTLTELVEVTDDETEIHFCLSRDLDPNASCITKVSNTLSSQTQGNRVVIPEGRITGSIDFRFNTRIAQGDTFSCYHYRILRDGQVIESGSFTSDTFLLKLDTMKAGDVLQFALETLRDGQSVTSAYMDSGVLFAPVPTDLNNLVYSLSQVMSGDSIKLNKDLPFTPSKTYHWESPVQKTMEKIPGTKLSEKGDLLTKEINKVTIEDSKTSWKFPLSVKYDVSGKMTFTAQLGWKKEGTVYNHTTTSKYYKDAPINMSIVRHGELVDLPYKNFSVSLEIVMQYDAGKDDWDMRMYLTQNGKVEMEIAKFTVLGIGFLKIEGTLNESAKWALVETGVGLDESVVILADGLTPKTGEIGSDIKGSIGAQAFTDKLASADVYAKSGVTVKLFPNPKALISASVGGEASFLIWSDETDFISEEWEVSLGSSSSAPLSLIELYSNSDTELSLPFSGSGSSWTGSTSGSLLTNAYHQARPQMVTLPDGTALLVWEDYTGEELNPVALYWARFDGEHWTEPALVDTDGTVDLSPALVATETGAQLVWVDFNQKLTPDLASLTYDEVEKQAGQLLNVSVAAFDETLGTWNQPTTIQETGIAVRPQITQDRTGQTVVAWLGNEAGLAQGTAEHHDCVGWAVLDEGTVMDRGTVALPVSNALELSIASGTSGVRMAVLAGNGAENARVYESFLLTDGWSQPEAAHNMSGTDTSACVGDDGSLYFIHSGCLYRKTTGTVDLLLSSEWLCENTAGLTWVKTNQGAALLWTASGEAGSAICLCRITQDGAALQPTVLVCQDALPASPTGAEVNGSLWLIHRRGELANEAWHSSLHIQEVDIGVDLAISKEQVVHSSYLIPGTAITTSVEVTTLGLTSPKQFELSVAQNRDGTEKIASVISSHGLTATLQWTVPTDYSGEELYLIVSPVGTDDQDMANNVLTLTNVVREVSIGRTCYVGRIDGQDLFTTRVENLGLTDSGELTLTVTAGEEELVVHQTTLTSLAAGSSRILTLALEPLNDALRQNLTFTLSVHDWESDTTDNKDFLTLPSAAEADEITGIIVTDALWTDGNNVPVDKIPDGIVRAQLTLEKQSETTEQLSLILAAYNEDGQMLASNLAAVMMNGAGTAELVCDLDLSTLDIARVKTFLLDNNSSPVTTFPPLES